MKNHVTSFGISKKLKEAGWKKETKFLWSNFYFYDNEESTEWKKLDKFYIFQQQSYEQDYNTLIKIFPFYKEEYPKPDDAEEYPAPLFTEILEELPATITIENKRCELIMDKIKVAYLYEDSSTELRGYFNNKNISDTLARIWLFFKKR